MKQIGHVNVDGKEFPVVDEVSRGDVKSMKKRIAGIVKRMGGLKEKAVKLGEDITGILEELMPLAEDPFFNDDCEGVKAVSGEAKKVRKPKIVRAKPDRPEPQPRATISAKPPLKEGRKMSVLDQVVLMASKKSSPISADEILAVLTWWKNN